MVLPSAAHNKHSRSRPVNISAGETAFTTVNFDNPTTAEVEALTELPLSLDSTRNPLNFDSWMVYGYNKDVQLDNFRAQLFPLLENTN